MPVDWEGLAMPKCVPTTNCGVATVMLLAMGVAIPAAADDMSDCKQSADPDIQIRGCTNLIEAGSVNGNDRATAYYNRGSAFRAKRDLDRAIADLEEAIQINPDSIVAAGTLGIFYNDRAAAHSRKGDHGRAIADYSKSLQFRPSGLTHYNRGRAYVFKGDYDRAIVDYDEAIQTVPFEQASIYYDRGVAHRAKGNFDLALADWDKAIEINPEDAFAYTNRGAAYAFKGDYDRAIADYDRATEINPEDAIAYLNRGIAYFYKDDFNLAVPALRNIAQGGNVYDVYGMLWLFMAQNRAGQDATTELTSNAANARSSAWPYPVIDLYLGKQSADATFAKAASAIQKCEAYFYIGEWHLMQGRQDAAVSGFRSAVEICPKHFAPYAGAVAELGRIK